MASRTEFDIVIVQGASFELPLRWYTDSTKTALLDLTSYTARFQARETFKSDNTIISLTQGSGITLTNGSSGTNIAISLTDEETLALEAPLRGVYELLLTNPAGFTRRVLHGKITVEPGVVR